MEVDLEEKLAKWNGAQTADYGAICHDLAQLKLNKVPVKSTCFLIVHQVLSAMAGCFPGLCSRLSVVRDTHCSTFQKDNT